MRIDLLREAEGKSTQTQQNQPGEKYRLRQDNRTKAFNGRLRCNEEHEREFPEDGIGLRVVLKMKPDAMTRKYFELRDRKL